MESSYTSNFPMLEGVKATIKELFETHEHSQQFQNAHFLFVDAIALALAETHPSPSEELELMLQSAEEKLSTGTPAHLLFEASPCSCKSIFSLITLYLQCNFLVQIPPLGYNASTLGSHRRRHRISLWEGYHERKRDEGGRWRYRKSRWPPNNPLHHSLPGACLKKNGGAVDIKIYIPREIIDE